MVKVGVVEIYDVGACAFAFLGAGMRAHCRPSVGDHWFEFHIEEETENDLDFAKELLLRASDLANRTPMMEIKYMARCCGIGQLLTMRNGGDECFDCGAKRERKSAGECYWRVPDSQKMLHDWVDGPIRHGDAS